MTTTTLVYKGYSVTSSLGERNIFLKLVDQVSFATYEATVEQKHLRVHSDMPTILKLINKTFQNIDENYKVDISILSNFLKLEFHALVAGWHPSPYRLINVTFDIVLREKVVAADALVTFRLEQQVKLLEEKYQQQVTVNVELQKRMEVMAQYMEKMHAKLSELQQQTKMQSHCVLNGLGEIGQKELAIVGPCNFYQNIQYMYRLRTLYVTLTETCNHQELHLIASRTLEKLYLSTSSGVGCTIELTNLPNLKLIRVTPSVCGCVNGEAVDIFAYCGAFGIKYETTMQ